MNFMFCYTLCHKEAHNFGTLFKQPWNYVLKNVFNRWVGVFHGIMPGTFTISHVFNHHRYDNGEKVTPPPTTTTTITTTPSSQPHRHTVSHHSLTTLPPCCLFLGSWTRQDVICTIMRPRDEFKSLVKFLPSFFAYASNVSTIQSLIEEGRPW
jgi:hypothetical protein